MNKNSAFIQGPSVASWLTKLFFEEALLWLWEISCPYNCIRLQVQYILKRLLALSSQSEIFSNMYILI
jgi:hypothetical protein